MKELFRHALYAVYRWLPKRNHVVVWGWPDGEDNSLALVSELEKSQIDKVFVLVTNLEIATAIFGSASPKVRCVAKNSAKAVFCFLFARYVFFTHRCFMKKFPSNVVSVNVWHGMPLKKIGWLLKDGEGINSRHALATSAFWEPIMQEAMKPFASVLTTGLPRNDRLFSERSAVKRKLGIANRSDIERIVAWLPTYRQSVRGEIRTDGKDFGNVFGLPDARPEDLNAYARDRKALIWIKAHPMSAFSDQTMELSHLRVVNDAWLQRKKLSLYELLGGSDVLMSDLSSVTVDYLLLDRPIIHVFPDIEAYRSFRGFTIEPIEDYFMGPATTNMTDLKRVLKAVLAGNDPDGIKRRKMTRLFHGHRDGHATRRLLDALDIRSDCAVTERS